MADFQPDSGRSSGPIADRCRDLLRKAYLLGHAHAVFTGGEPPMTAIAMRVFDADVAVIEEEIHRMQRGIKNLAMLAYRSRKFTQDEMRMHAARLANEAGAVPDICRSDAEAVEAHEGERA